MIMTDLNVKENRLGGLLLFKGKDNISSSNKNIPIN